MLDMRVALTGVEALAQTAFELHFELNEVLLPRLSARSRGESSGMNATLFSRYAPYHAAHAQGQQRQVAHHTQREQDGVCGLGAAVVEATGPDDGVETLHHVPHEQIEGDRHPYESQDPACSTPNQCPDRDQETRKEERSP